VTIKRQSNQEPGYYPRRGSKLGTPRGNKSKGEPSSHVGNERVAGKFYRKEREKTRKFEVLKTEGRGPKLGEREGKGI